MMETVMDDQEHGMSVYQTKKSRGINWTHEEKLYLVSLCTQRANVIEERKSDLITLSRKASAWKYIHDKFSLRFGRKRTPVRIKEQWKRMKIAARARMRDESADKSWSEITAKYYGESHEIINKVKVVLKSLESPDLTTCALNDDVITIKVEPCESEVNGEFAIPNEPTHIESLRQSPMPMSYPVTPEAPSMNVYRDQPRRQHDIDFNSTLNHRKTPTSSDNETFSQIRGRNSQGIDDNSRILSEYLVECARMEHRKKMEYLETEHNARMEILKIEREIATNKLKLIDRKIRLSSVDF